MKDERRLCSKVPHPDVENNIQRGPIPYFINFPSDGIGEDTGLIFTISAFGLGPEQEYEEKLRHYLSNQYNCIVVGVDYFGCSIKCPSEDSLRFPDDFFDNFKEMYQMDLGVTPDLPVKAVLPVLSNVLRSIGKKRFEPPLHLLANGKDIYQSFGILPALDYLQVLSELLKMYSIDKKRLYILSSSYGSYIGLLLGKIAPNTFRFIMDNSAFVEPYLPSVYGSNDGTGTWVSLGGAEIFLMEDTLWSKDATSPCYFDKHHYEIRSLLMSDHIYPSDTQYFCFHSPEDILVSDNDKMQFKTLRPEMDIDLDIITEDKVDGRIFKNTQHGMDASIRGVFDLVYNKYMDKGASVKGVTDFDLQSQYIFPCSNGFSYKINYTNDDVSLELLKG